MARQDQDLKDSNWVKFKTSACYTGRDAKSSANSKFASKVGSEKR